MSYSGTKTKLKFTASYLKQDKISYNHGKIVNIYIVYDLGAVTLTTNTDIDNISIFTCNIVVDIYNFS